MGWFNDNFGFDIPLITGKGSITDALAGESGSPGLFSDPTGAWDSFKNGETNSTNEEIAEENLAYQRERAGIEDKRYEDETAYNRAFQEEERDYQRAFAEDERAYNRALQERLFEREDTAQLRQAQQLSALGINPLSQQLNGAAAGQVVGSSGAGSPVGNPSLSSRGGSALHNDFKMQDMGAFQALSPLLSLASTLNGVETGSYQRDALALQNDAQFLKNLNDANKLGIEYHGYIPRDFENTSYRKNGIWFYTPNDHTPLEETKEYKDSLYSGWKKNYLDNLPEWGKSLSSLGDDSVYDMAEKALTRASDLYGKSFDKMFDKDNAQTPYDLGKDKFGHFNPFNMLLNLFF